MNANNPNLFLAVRSVLLSDWDPLRIQELGVEICNSNLDEYDRYIPEVVRLISDGASVKTLSDYLTTVEMLFMGRKTRDGRSDLTAMKLFALNSSSS